MLYILQARRRRAASKRTADALEAVLDAYTERCRAVRERGDKVKEETERILAHIEKDAADDGNP
ncbi:hypothetical protein ABZ307_28380 [Streptomyces griseorubiginosus]|uniref:hypothetical protein n=1 Tax=Streptomyces griseorubiginosus TaxID=67304 RepID=UPI0033B3A586